jgi:hypothetical protein
MHHAAGIVDLFARIPHAMQPLSRSILRRDAARSAQNAPHE